MTSWRHEIKKWKINDIFELSDLKNHGNKKRINFLAHLQVEIGINPVKWRHDMTSWRHGITQIEN